MNISRFFISINMSFSSVSKVEGHIGVKKGPDNHRCILFKF